MKLLGTALHKLMALCALAVIGHCNGFGYDAGLPGFGSRHSAGSFAVVENGVVAPVIADSADELTVGVAARLFADDVERSTGLRPRCGDAPLKGERNVVIVGTVGRSALIDRLVKSGKLDVDSLRGQWERFRIATVKKPFKGVDNALVVAGSDRRGAAYGILSLSEQMGVSPWYYWADVPVRHHAGNLYVDRCDYLSHAPSVKYRGIFLNDEGWGLWPWAAKTDDPALGDIGPKTYAKVCELILRSKGNMLAPAMHPCSGAFYTHSENKLVADSFGIIIGTSHCEPLHFNNTTEWHKDAMGEWNYRVNKEGINRVLDARVAETAPFENIYTIAMRGIHDGGMVGAKTDDDKVDIMTEVIADQREIISRHKGCAPEEIPQIFVPYKEVLDIYEHGLKVPDDVTIVWPDDNFGYIKRLSNEAERGRGGGAGVYYHISYLGEPHDYIWLCTTPPTLMLEEMRKAYDTGASRYWLLNVGDIKPGELGMRLFMAMAWDIDSFSYENVNSFNNRWLAEIFGKEYGPVISEIIDEYYILAAQRKPEAMGWGIEWNNYHHFERMTDTDFSMANYREAERREEAYSRITLMARDIYNRLSPELRPAFYELVLYPVEGASLMNKKMLAAQRNRLYARQGRKSTARWAELTKLYKDSLDAATATYNGLLGGKWNHMMALPPGWTATYMNLPQLDTITVPAKADMAVFVAGEECLRAAGNMHQQPCLTPSGTRETFIEIYNRGEEPFEWTATASDDRILISERTGTIDDEGRIAVGVDWSRVPDGETISGEIKITGAGKTEPVYFSAYNPGKAVLSDAAGMFVEDNGAVAINAGDFSRKAEKNDIEIMQLPVLGYEGSCVQLGKVTDKTQDTWWPDAPHVEYDFYTFNSGRATVYTYALPTFPADSKRDTRYGVMIDDGWIHRPNITVREYSGAWLANTARNAAVNVSSMMIDKPGHHVLKIYCIDPGVVIQKIVIDMGGMRRSYLGPEVRKVAN